MNCLWDDYNYYDEEDIPGKDQLEMEVDLGPQEKLVATDSFKVQVYTENLIDEVKEVKSRGIAQTTLKNLKTNTKYGWYANIEDDNDGQTRSDIQLFTTGTKSENSQGGSNSSSNGNNSEQKDNKMKNWIKYYIRLFYKWIKLRREGPSHFLSYDKLCEGPSF